MIKRICPNCGAENYSADTISSYWVCCKCGTKISKKPKEGSNNVKRVKDG